MNPFDLRGPDFLLLYGVAATALILLALGLQASVAAITTPPSGRIADPLVVAWAVGGRRRALEVAVQSMLGRRMLALDGTRIVRGEAVPDSNTAELERAVLGSVAGGTAAGRSFREIQRHTGVESAIARIRERACAAGLAPSPAGERVAVVIRWAVPLLLLAFAAAKIAVAVSRGRPNIGFLIVLSIAAALVACVVLRPRRTPAAGARLRELRTLLYGAAHRRRKAGGAYTGAPSDTLLLAVFGQPSIVGVPSASRAACDSIAAGTPSWLTWSDSWGARRGGSPERGTGSGCGASFVSCSSSCGASGSSSCGSSCGGGGCGGCGS